MSYYSPEAQKAMENAALRDKLWWPRLKRTETRLVLFHALRNRRGQRRATRETMFGLGWKWEAKLSYFYTDLTPERLEVVLDAWTNRGGRLCLSVSKGVREYREEVLP